MYFFTGLPSCHDVLSSDKTIRTGVKWFLAEFLEALHGWHMGWHGLPSCHDVLSSDKTIRTGVKWSVAEFLVLTVSVG